MNYDAFKEFFKERYSKVADTKRIVDFDEVELLGYLYKLYPNSTKKRLTELYSKGDIASFIYVKVLKLLGGRVSK